MLGSWLLKQVCHSKISLACAAMYLAMCSLLQQWFPMVAGLYWPFSAGASWLDLNCGCPIYGMCSGRKLPDDTILIKAGLQ